MVEGMLPSDADLLHAMTLGDHQAFAQFYDRHSALVFSLVVRMLHQQTDAEDVLQETFLQVWRQANRFDPTRCTPQGWLVMMARSRALDKIRKKNLATTSANTPDDCVYPEGESRLEQTETTAQLRAALQQLPDEQRLAIDLAFFGGLTYEHVAQQQGVPLGTAKTRIRLGMNRLRRLLDEAEGMST